MNAPDSAEWTAALADTLVPADISAGRPVRLDCDDSAVADAGRLLGIPRAQATAQLVDCLRSERLISPDRGVTALARATSGQPPMYLTGLAVLVLAASRMATDQRALMREYYLRLADLLGIPLAPDWPQVRGVPDLVARFEDLAAWLAHTEDGRRGLLDVPGDVHPSIVGVPISQSLLRAGDRITLGAFFERTSHLIDAGWDPVHQLHGWGGRHQLTAPLLGLLARSDLHHTLAGALRAARRSWDGSTIDATGRRLLPGQLRLHLPPPAFMLSVTVPALPVATTATGPDGTTISVDAHTPAAVPVEWLRFAENSTVVITAGDERVRVLDGPTMLFENTPLGLQSVSAAAEDPVWVLTCQQSLICACADSQRFAAAGLPSGWALLCDIEPEQLHDELRIRRDDEVRPLHGVSSVGGLRLRGDVWLLDHPPQIVADLPEPAPVSIDDIAHGDLELGRALTLETIAHRPGVHHIDVGEQRLTVELAARGPRDGTGTLGVDLNPRRVYAGARSITDVARCVIGPLTLPAPADISEPGLIVRYRSAVDVIDVDGTVRALGPPAPAAWLDHVGLPQTGPWEIPDPSRVVWLCVNAARGKFIVAQQPVDVPLTDDVLNVVEWYADSHQLVDRSDGRATDRWRRLLSALEGAA